MVFLFPLRVAVCQMTQKQQFICSSQAVDKMIIGSRRRRQSLVKKRVHMPPTYVVDN